MSTAMSPIQHPLVRYPLLYAKFVRYCLVREMSFRFNFLARAAVSVGWLFLLVLYFDLIFGKTRSIGDWSRSEYLFLMGTWFFVQGFVEVFFLENCTRFSELIRTGNLDFVLLKPVDAQFLASLERIDIAEIPSTLFGLGLVTYATYVGNLPVSWGRAVGFLLLSMCGIAILYSFMLMLASISVWVVRTQSLHELWFYIVQFGRYPSEIYGDSILGISIRVALLYIVPVMLAVNVPAGFAIKTVAGPFILYTVVAAFVLLAFSRWFFYRALERYRSASS
jgi:ABC-2 type transport system permease protein